MTISKSDLLFLGGCIPSRILLTMFAQNPNPIMLILASVVSLGFLRLWLNPSLRPTGIETFGKPIWWHDIRIIHALLWGLFVVAAIMEQPWAWKLLAVDVIVGLFSFFFIKNN